MEVTDGWFTEVQCGYQTYFHNKGNTYSFNALTSDYDLHRVVIAMA